MEQKASIGKAIGRIPSGVFALTSDRHGQRDGLLASWVSQAAFEPPMLSVAIKKERHILELLCVGSRFTLNVLSKNNMDIYKNFVKPYQEGMDRYDGLNVLPANKGGPIFAEAVAFMDCITRTMVEAGDHVILLGEIVDGALLQSENEPMVHLRSNGFQY
jgi:flavin reductase (DIM6/NTAB) family NADH-FMN oxidoreductase RutF